MNSQPLGIKLPKMSRHAIKINQSTKNYDKKKSTKMEILVQIIHGIMTNFQTIEDRLSEKFN